MASLSFPGAIRLAVVVAVCAFAGTGAYAQNDDLVSAAERGDSFAVKRLVQAGVDVNQRKFLYLGVAGDATSLMVASYRGSLEMVQALLAAKADVDATLSEKKDGETALTLAVQQGSVEVVRALLAANADVDHRGPDVSALYAAARAANLDMVKVLLTAKPNLNRQGKSGETALMWGISTGRRDSPEIARLLIDAGAHVNLPNRNGVTALTLAVQRDLPTVQRLLAAGAEVDFRFCSVDASTPVRPRGFVLSWDRAHTTALAIASTLGKADMVRALLAAKADVNLAQCDGKTPLTLALENDHQQVAELLKSAGAK